MNAATVVSTTPVLVSVQEIPLSKISESKTNPRRQFDETKLAELAANIRQYGVLQAILVRPIGEAGSFEVVAGTRRYRASKLAGRETIPATVRELTDAQCLELQLIENLQRSDVHELDEAQGYAALMQLRGISGNYFQAIGAPLLRGREFGAGDMANPSRVVVINQAMAAQFGPGAEPIGQQIINPYNNSSREIVGVVGNIKSFGQ